jgi:hypothetical protein
MISALVLPPWTGGVETARKLLQETLLRLLVPVGLLHGAAVGIDRIDRAAGGVAALLAGRRIVLLVDLPGLQIRKPRVADVLENQRLGAVANDDPFASADLQPGHEIAS